MDLPTILATIAVFALSMLALGVGVIFAGRVLRGSCGGLSSGGEESCELCPNRHRPLRRLFCSGRGKARGEREGADEPALRE